MFESARLKVERAVQHIEQLESVFRAFVKENPRTIVIQPNADTGQISVGVNFSKPLPPHLSTVAGDAVHNLRTALDHLACELVRLNGGAVRGHTGFPFHEDRANFEANFEGKIEGASKNAIDLIKAVEPYNGGIGQPLWRLNKLDVADKHHSLLLAVRVTHLPKIVARNPDGGAIATLVNCRVEGNGRIKMISVPAGSTFEIENQDQAPIEIRFANTEVLRGKDVVVSLKKLSKGVLRVIEIFEGRSDGLVNPQ